MLADEWGPPQAKNLHFENVFRVLDGEALVPADMPVLTDAAQIAAHEGRLVQLRGALVDAKGATLLDVSVASESRRMNGATVSAVGVLRRWNVPHDPNPWDSVATRRGTFFSLVDPWRGGTAKVTRIDAK